MKDSEEDSSKSPPSASSIPYACPLPTLARPPYYPPPMYFVPHYGRQVNTPANNHSQIMHTPDRIFSSQQASTLSIQELSRKYELKIRQQPLRARMCGCGDKDRRAVDPPPIIEATVLSLDGELISPSDVETFSNLVLHVSLYSEDGQTRITHNQKIPQQLPILIGTVSTTPTVLNDDCGNNCLLFIFPDLSVRIEGIFKLKFTLMDLRGSMEKLIHKAHIAKSILSSSLRVFTPKEFPGMSDSSELSRVIASQGFKIPIRKERPPREKKEDVD